MKKIKIALGTKSHKECAGCNLLKICKTFFKILLKICIMVASKCIFIKGQFFKIFWVGPSISQYLQLHCKVIHRVGTKPPLGKYSSYAYVRMIKWCIYLHSTHGRCHLQRGQMLLTNTEEKINDTTLQAFLKIFWA